MARTIEEIYNSMVGEKQTFSSLNGLLPNNPPKDAYTNLLAELSSMSRVAIWRLVYYVIAVGHWTLEKLWDYHRQELEALADEKISGNPQWYKAEVLKWQYGHILLWNGLKYHYYYADTTSAGAIASRLAKRVSVDEVYNADFRGLKVKVAKINSSNVLVPLTATELDALQSYVDRVKFAGVQTDIISQPSDKIKLSLKVYYQGTIDEAQMLLDVKAAIQNYIDNIEFDGVFYLIKMVDAIQAIKGISDVVIQYAQGKTYLSGYGNITKDYLAESGWFELDTTSIYELIKV